MIYRVTFLPVADKHLRRFPRKMQQRISAAAGKLAFDPRPPGSRKLAGRGGAYRIRVGNYRIIYTVNDSRREVEVGIVADRKDAYDL